MSIFRAIHSVSASAAQQNADSPTALKSRKMALVVISVEEVKRSEASHSATEITSEGIITSATSYLLVPGVERPQPLCPRPGCSPSEWLASLRLTSSADHPARGQCFSVCDWTTDWQSVVRNLPGTRIHVDEGYLVPEEIPQASLGSIRERRCTDSLRTGHYYPTKTLIRPPP